VIGADDSGLEPLLEYLKRSRGFDFTAYKRSSLSRRIDKRLQALGLENNNEYLDFLEVHPLEFNHLFNTILINVTGFFRDQPNWDYLAKDALPPILAAKGPKDPIRIWSAGCSSGEEAYTVSMVLAEALGIEPFRERVKVYATDVDEEALNTARAASYGSSDVEVIPPALMEKYFYQENGRFAFHKDLRRSVIFGRHDLVQDAPISHVDILICRNVLMYFNAETQEKILARFHFGLHDSGVLFLGRAEMLLTHGSTFEPVDLPRRMFRKVLKSTFGERMQVMARADHGRSAVLPASIEPDVYISAFETSQTAQIILDLDENLLFVSEHARALFDLGHRDVGSKLQDLKLPFRSDDLHGAVTQVLRDRRTINLKEVQWASSSGKEDLFFQVRVRPLTGAAGRLLGVGVSFIDVTTYKHAEEQLRLTKQEVETAYEELQSTNEELETTNEELQSTVEELETTNEELQSTNEELETMNEELQSTNEELHTVNEQLRVRTDELNETNAFLETVMSSMRNAVIVVDRDMKILSWNPKTQDLWGLRSEEALGKNLLNLDIGLPAEQLRAAVRACLSGEAEARTVTVQAVNRRGKTFQCAVDCAPLVVQGKDIRGVVIMLHETAGEASS